MKPRITLVEMPFSTLTSPHLGLSILKAEAEMAGLPTHIEYGSLRFVGYLGISDSNDFQIWDSYSNFVEMLFLPYAGFAACSERDRSLAFYEDRKPYMKDDVLKMKEICRHADTFLDDYLDMMADRVLASEPDLVGVTWTFHQLNADLALLKKLKEKKPDLITFIGGSACTYYAGQVVVDHMPQVDYGFTGESDEIFAEACTAMAERNDSLLKEKFPCVLYKGGHGRPYATKDMNRVAYPDFSDYFATLKETGMDRNMDVVLPVEGSRGCWWGCRGRCNFCGINPDEETVRYRDKDPERFADELRFLAEKYGVSTFWLSDCILSRRHVRDLPGLLEKDHFRLFSEVKTNMTHEEIAGLRRAGFRSLQPGIESLQDDLLKLMNKGNTAIRHVEFLKNARTEGIHLTWNIICGFPGEKTAWYEEMADLLPLYVHLEPPHTNNLMYLRTSRFRVEKEKYGVETEPDENYPYIYGRELAAEPDFIEYYQPVGGQDLSGLGFFFQAIGEWQQEFMSGHMLCFYDQMGFLAVSDTRNCAVRRSYAFDGLERAVCLACDQAIREDKLIERLMAEDPKRERAAIEKVIEDLIGLKLLLKIGDSLLFLAIPKSYHRWETKKIFGMSLLKEKEEVRG